MVLLVIQIITLIILELILIILYILRVFLLQQWQQNLLRLHRVILRSLFIVLLEYLLEYLFNSFLRLLLFLWRINLILIVLLLFLFDFMIMFLLLLLIYGFNTSVWVEVPPYTTAHPSNAWGNSPVDDS